MTLYLWALLGGAAAVFVEWMFRTYAHVGFWKLEPFALPFQILIGLSVYKIFTGTPHFLVGAVIFPFGTASMRLLVQTLVYRSESPPLSVYVAFGCIIVAQIVRILPWEGK